MAGTLVPVRITVACGYGDVGRTFTPNGMVRQWLLENGFAVLASEAEPTRPAKLTRSAAKKIADATKGLFGGNTK